MKSHILEFFHDPIVRCICGTNGYIWIYSDADPSSDERLLMATLRNAIIVLEKQKLPIFKDTIIKVLEEQVNLEVEPKMMVANQELLAKTAHNLIDGEIKMQKPVNIQALMD